MREAYLAPWQPQHHHQFNLELGGNFVTVQFPASGISAIPEEHPMCFDFRESPIRPFAARFSTTFDKVSREKCGTPVLISDAIYEAIEGVFAQGNVPEIGFGEYPIV